MIEIDVSRASIDKLPIYAEMGVPEVWRVADGRVVLLRLGDGGYATADESVALPPLTAAVPSRFLADSHHQPRTAWLRALRAWVRVATATR